jgi:hypothetical protein
MSLSLTAIILSIFGIALSDPESLNFKGIVTAKNIDPNRLDQSNNHKYLVKFEISNLMQEPIINFIYKIRYPSVIEFSKSKSNTNPPIIASNKTRYLTDSSFSILTGIETEPENKIIVTLAIPLKNWSDKTGHIYFTITGENIKPVVFILKNKSSRELLNRKEVVLEKKDFV